MKYIVFGSIYERRHGFIYNIISTRKNGTVYEIVNVGNIIRSFSADDDEYIVISSEDGLRGRRVSDYIFLIDGYSDNDVQIASRHSYNVPISWDDYLKSISGHKYIVELI